MSRMLSIRSFLLLTAIWFYFLVFAQFALLHRVEALCSPEELKWMLGGMTLAGITGSLLAGARCHFQNLRLWLVGSLALAAFAAGLAGKAGTINSLWLPSILTGLSLGMLTVSAVAWVAVHHHRREAVLLSGAGTGLAYFLANVPTIFQASPVQQSLLAALACGLVMLVVPGGSSGVRPPAIVYFRAVPLDWQSLALAVLVFGILVWVDSGAFAWMQTVRSFRDAAWGQSSALWSIGLVHALTAVGTAYALSRPATLWHACLTALALLMVGYAMISVMGLGLPGVWVYMIGVSIYSTALLAYPFLYGSPGGAARFAGWLFALSGWLASALGIGMVEDLGRMPAICWVVAALLVAAAMGPVRKFADR